MSFPVGENKVGIRGEVLTAMNIKIAVFWHVMMCRLAGKYECFRGICSFHLQNRTLAEDGGCRFIQNFGTFLAAYTAHPRR